MHMFLTSGNVRTVQHFFYHSTVQHWLTPASMHALGGKDLVPASTNTPTYGAG
jgi:hypothetical protein